MPAVKNYLVTGAAGFIGSHFVDHLLAYQPDARVISVDLLTYAANKAFLAQAETTGRHTFVQGNITNAAMMGQIFFHHRIDCVVHFAAESHVDRSIIGSEVFVRSNVLGTYVLLEAARRYWETLDKAQPRRFHHVSTDEVYGSLGEKGFFSEKTAYAPNSPYSATKAGSDMLVRAWHHTYGMDTTVTNCSNNFGPRQHDEKLIPTVIRRALKSESIPIYGDGKNIRDWLCVRDHCRAILAVLDHGESGETYCIGSNNEQDNNTIATLLCELLDELHPRKDRRSYAEHITYVADRLGHDRRYAIDSRKIRNRLGWKPARPFRDALRETVQWYIALYSQ
ncbi:MAG: dTDP-glucose 4,6-dehydratase [Holosporales bacterium]